MSLLPFPPQATIRSISDIAPYIAILSNIQSRFIPACTINDTDSGYGDGEPVDDGRIEHQIAVEGIKKWLFRRMEELETLHVEKEEESKCIVEALERTAGVLEEWLNDKPSDDVSPCESDIESWSFTHATLKLSEPSASRTGSDVEIGTQIWNAGLVLSRLIDASHLFPPYPTNILELGCGTGLTSILAAMVLPPTTHITATDFHPIILETALKNARLNNVEERVSFQVLDWNNPPTHSQFISTVLAADVIYAPEHARILPKVIHTIFVNSLSAEPKQAVIVNRIRPQFFSAISDFEKNMEAFGFVGTWVWADELLDKVEKQRYRVYRFAWKDASELPSR
ncbi:uncharacterized protein SPPG_01005 [Spizellomyces punctatus DAOM BR117]|uniref:Methyltransferase small domain-containing protein n=1 Tax=Spizellomyces punctatus (strain DAOM BR117) TaxID=645134 RepID=A0A0L0HRM3_SPIPD|nr:uncharacterized protein SPPG_01005 [Spizellomyces punctatus DAOM BR117]KND03524.1 hypothetical protein SPPG_01005 [Spizellomyces punctatus DAOM BR117]|eukprot:XP_016611563.1 hypothetical protein SPPG_01005 [Spizellomyces punctatus DAOM BR117]